jgi:alpha-aminoadipate/glutamate carrier protein LysW
MVNCPLCSTGIDVEEDELDEGDSLICEDCGANLNVVSVDPIELSKSEEDEDEDDDEDDFDEEDDDDDYDEDDDEDEDEEDDDEE